MNPRVTLVSHAATAATNAAAFPAGEPLDARGTGWARSARGALPRADRVLVAPERSCRETAVALGLDAATAALLRDWDLGRWSGRTLDDVAAAEPAAARAWLTDPTAAPHGGEPLGSLLSRTAGWLDALPAAGHTVAITHPAVVRAAVLAVLDAPPRAFWRVDVAPLTATVLRGRPGRWTLRSTGRPLGTSGPAWPS